jgi:hypothetical protein
MANDEPQRNVDTGQEQTQDKEPQDVTLSPVAVATQLDRVELRARVRDLSNQLSRRFAREGRWPELQLLRNKMIDECLSRHMPKLDAQAWVYSELARLYPPLPPPVIEVATLPGESVNNDIMSPINASPQSQTTSDSSTRLQGLSNVPESWGKLPANASLAADIGWVQSNRLYVVEEKSSNLTVVHLDRAHEPAPSRAALGWLETSIRSYAKFVDVAAKALTVATDEAEHIRREDIAIEEIRALLDEMHKD